MVSCPYCGNTYAIMSYSDNMYRCPKCNFYFSEEPTLLSNASTAPIENNITIRLPYADKVDKGFYYSAEKYSNINLPEYKLTINAKDIIIKDDKISITIDTDNIDKFDVIEINGVRFVRGNN